VEDFENRAAGTSRVVEEFVGIGGVGKFEEALAVHRVGCEFREDFEEEAAGNSGYVKVVQEEGAKSGWARGVQVVQGWDVGGFEERSSGGNVYERCVRNCGPVHEVDQAINIFGEVLGVD
jgi:hypothetical protein